jgi:hypothetical protein
MALYFMALEDEPERASQAGDVNPVTAHLTDLHDGIESQHVPQV